MKVVPCPQVSIVVLRRNGEEPAVTTLDSVRLQTFCNYEVIVGSMNACNVAVGDAAGEYVAFIEPDQTWMAEKLEKQMARLAETALSWCYCGAVDCGSTLHSGRVLRPLLLKNFIPGGSVVMRRDVFNELGGFSESAEFETSEDWDLWLRMAGEYPVAVVAEPLVHLPRNAVGERSQTGMKRVVEAAVARYESQLKDLRSEALAELCVAAGNAYLQANRRDEARVEFAEALTHSPLRPDAYLSWVSSFLSNEAQQQIRDLHNLSRAATPAQRKEKVAR